MTNRNKYVLSRIKQTGQQTLPPNSSLLLYGSRVLVATRVRGPTGTYSYCLTSPPFHSTTTAWAIRSANWDGIWARKSIRRSTRRMSGVTITIRHSTRTLNTTNWCCYESE